MRKEKSLYAFSRGIKRSYFQIPSPQTFAWAFREQNTHIRPYYSYNTSDSMLCRVPFLKRTLHALTYSNLDPWDPIERYSLVDPVL